MRRAHAGDAPRRDFAALGDERAQQPHVLVVDVVDPIDTKPAHFLAPEILFLAGDRLVAAGGPLRSANRSSAFCLCHIRFFLDDTQASCLFFRFYRSSRRHHRLSGHCRHRGRAVRRGTSGHRRSGRLNRRPAGRPFLTRFFPLLDFFHLLVDAHGDELDHNIGDAKAALNLLNQLRRGAELDKYKNALVVLLQTVGQLSHAPFVRLLDGSVAGGDHLFDLVDEAVDLFLRRVRLDDKQCFVESHSSSWCKPRARRLNIVMDFSTPSASMDSTAAAPRPTTSSTSFLCDRLIGASTNFSPSTGRPGWIPRRTRGILVVPKLPITLFTPLCPASEPFGLIFSEAHGRSSSS